MQSCYNSSLTGSQQKNEISLQLAHVFTDTERSILQDHDFFSHFLCNRDFRHSLKSCFIKVFANKYFPAAFKHLSFPMLVPLQQDCRSVSLPVRSSSVTVQCFSVPASGFPWSATRHPVARFIRSVRYDSVFLSFFKQEA